MCVSRLVAVAASCSLSPYSSRLGSTRLDSTRLGLTPHTGLAGWLARSLLAARCSFACSLLPPPLPMGNNFVPLVLLLMLQVVVVIITPIVMHYYHWNYLYYIYIYKYIHIITSLLNDIHIISKISCHMLRLQISIVSHNIT